MATWPVETSFVLILKREKKSIPRILHTERRRNSPRKIALKDPFFCPEVSKQPPGPPHLGGCVNPSPFLSSKGDVTLPAICTE